MEFVLVIAAIFLAALIAMSSIDIAVRMAEKILLFFSAIDPEDQEDDTDSSGEDDRTSPYDRLDDDYQDEAMSW